MAYPFATNLLNPIKLRVLEASTTTSGTAATSVTVPFRAKYLYSVYSPSVGLAVPAAAGATTGINLLINGSTATADSFFTNPAIGACTTTSTAPGLGLTGALQGSAASPILILNQGDTITTQPASFSCAYSISHILQEF